MGTSEREIVANRNVSTEKVAAGMFSGKQSGRLDVKVSGRQCGENASKHQRFEGCGRLSSLTLPCCWSQPLPASPASKNERMNGVHTSHTSQTPPTHQTQFLNPTKRQPGLSHVSADCCTRSQPCNVMAMYRVMKSSWWTRRP